MARDAMTGPWRDRMRGAAVALACAAALGSASDSVAAVQQAATAVYTAAQAEAGRAVYTRECATCHQANLQGSFEAPPLAGRASCSSGAS